MIPARNYGVSVMSMGLLMGEDVAAVWRGPMVSAWGPATWLLAIPRPRVVGAPRAACHSLAAHRWLGPAAARQGGRPGAARRGGARAGAVPARRRSCLRRPLPPPAKQVMSALETFMRRVRWAPLDVLVIDMPPGTGEWCK